MATKIVFLQYHINLTDKDQVDTLQHRDDGTQQAVGAIIRAPDGAAVEFSAPILWKRQGCSAGDDPFVAPSITSDHLVKICLGPLEGQRYPTNVATFSRHTGGFLGIGGTTTKYWWRGLFVYVPPPDQPGIPGEPIVAMAKRRWTDGFEMPYQGDAGSASGSCVASPVASRHPGSLGLPIRNTTIYKRHTPIESGGAATDNGWDRLYVRLRRPPDTNSQLWSVLGTPSTTVGMGLLWTASGQIAIAALGTSIVNVLGSTTALTANTWYKLDALYKYGATGYFRLFVNGVKVFDMQATAMPSGQGMNAANNVAYCTVGGAPSNHHGSWDYDDWVGCDLPTGGTDPSILPGLDWLHGSKIVWLRAKGFGTTNGTWAGPGGSDAADWRHTTHRPVGSSTVAHQLTTSVASDRLVCTVDIDQVLAQKGNLGIVAMVVSRYGYRAGVVDGQLGYKIGAAAEVLATVTENTSNTWCNVWYQPTGLTEPEVWTAGLELVFVANSTAAAKSLTAMGAAVECIGDFFPEDHTPVVDDPADVTWGVPHFNGDIHNHPYEETEWAQKGPSPIGPVIIHAGTYVGNGKNTQLAFRAPVHMLWIRSTAATPLQTVWFSGNAASGRNIEENRRPELVSEVRIDPYFTPAGYGEDDQKMQTIVRISGNDAAVNANGTTYNYLAWCDPAMRFSAAGSLFESNYGAGVTAFGPTFLPEVGIFIQTTIAGAATAAGFWRGLGAAAGELFTMFGTAVLSNAMDYTAGEVQTPAGSGIYQADANIPFILFRRDDNSDDPGVKYVMQIATYTGDGTASRTIALAPVTGRRPMWAIVVGSNGSSLLRDGSHTGTTSSTPAGAANAATGIVSGGIDSISVGSVLNQAGVVYDVLVFPGCDATAGNNGWGVNCESVPVDPGTYDPDGDPDPWDPEPDEPSEEEPPPGEDEDPGPEGPGGPGPSPRSPYPDFDFDEDCVAWSQGIMNIALSRIGISKQIVDITTDVSAEATACRLHYSEDASATIRDFPWAFATRYQKMPLIMGDADGQDTVQQWLSTVWYVEGEVVRVSDVDYYCIDGHVNHQPPNVTYWSTEAPEEVNGDWLYCYRAPARMMFARRIVNPNKARRDWDPDPPRFRLAADDRAFTVYTNEQNAELEYTIRPVCVAAVDDAIFRSALAWRHAHSIAAALSRDEKKIAYCWEMYQAVLAQARRWAASEVQQAPRGDADWITGRN